MKLIILGSGTCIPHPTRCSSGYALLLPGSKLLLDCGAGSTWKLERAGIDYLDIDHIFITHFHPDHTADLIPFLFATRYTDRPQRTKPLTVWGPRGMEKLFSAFKQAYDGWIEPEGLEVREIGEGKREFTDFKIETSNTAHTENSLAYRVESEAKSLVYTGDTDYAEEVVGLARNADLLLIECSHPEELKMKGHLSPLEVARIANESKAKKVLLTHIYPAAEKGDVLSAVQKMVSVEVELAEDLMEVEI
ncbi:MAG: ribonuclease Z [Candidatus Dadabacteria bacterium]|nr:ribonuclease Z [Candidatus Dadabacteria bacterium]